MFDHQAVVALYNDYACGMDIKDFDLTRNTFAADAVFSLDIKGEQPMDAIQGGKTIGDFIEETTRGQGDQRRHVISNVRVVEEGGKQVGYAYLSLFVTDDSGLTPKATGLYRGEIVEEGGRLRFAKMHLALDEAF